jgi:hypothetical protein
MRVREAKALARSWIHEHGVAIAGFSGAILSGSINWAKEEDPWPSTSDVDIAVFVAGDTGTGFLQEYSKFFYNELILEVSIKPIDRIQSAEQILADYVLACSFSASSLAI